MYKVLVYWRDGRVTVAAESWDPTVLRDAPMVSRNARVIRRIEVHDTTGCLETIWDMSWD